MELICLLVVGLALIPLGPIKRHSSSGVVGCNFQAMNAEPKSEAVLVF